MANTTSPLLPATEALLQQFGERLRLARLRRRLPAKQVAERAGMTEVTLRRVERGMPGVTLGAYLAVMQVLQLQGDIEKWAMEDPLGRQLQDARTLEQPRPRRIHRVLKVKPAVFAAKTGQVTMAPHKKSQTAHLDELAPAPKESGKTASTGPANKSAQSTRLTGELASEPRKGMSSQDLVKLIRRSSKS